ncbi:hypothetical protein PFISCL1PPCAC_18755, partial [Pristionchus fissidentatus]
LSLPLSPWVDQQTEGRVETGHRLIVRGQRGRREVKGSGLRRANTVGSMALATTSTDPLEPIPPSLERKLRRLTFCLPQASLLIDDSIIYVHSTTSGRPCLTMISSTTGKDQAMVPLPDEQYDQLHLVRLNSHHIGMCYRDNGVWMRVVRIRSKECLEILTSRRIIELPSGYNMARVLAGHRAFYGAAWNSDGNVHLYDLGTSPTCPPAPAHLLFNFYVEEVAVVGRRLYLLTDKKIGLFDFTTGRFSLHESTGYVKNDAGFVEFEQATVWRDRHIFVLTGASELWRLDVGAMRWSRVMPLDSFPDVHVPCFTINEEGYLLVMTVWDFHEERSEARSYWITVPPLETMVRRSIDPPAPSPTPAENGEIPQ